MKASALPAKTAAAQLLEFFRLGGKKDDKASALAYGEERRLEIARALATDPSLLLLDEPSAGMNPQEVRELNELILQIRGSGKTIFLIEHNMRVIMDICDRIAVLDFGEKIAEGAPQEVAASAAVVAADGLIARPLGLATTIAGTMATVGSNTLYRGGDHFVDDLRLLLPAEARENILPKCRTDRLSRGGGVISDVPAQGGEYRCD